MERLRNSRKMLLIVGDTTRLNSDWVPFEIAQAIDSYKLPIITTYPAYLNIRIRAPCGRCGGPL